ncbi:glutathione S-transferase [Silvimonas terrae]|uniref:Glutathione S-transferase n=1 Tax=Silvimonas terrae TaxID=300266 RepID=A0A840RM51_9NEIS|nr:glutathione binding-like protein [Silvimonas terrae]MBB5193694.1 glutathione S-transferase [Silvimonas terrae]
MDIHTRPGERLLADGSDYHAINPMGQALAIRIRGGEVITENPVVLQYVPDQHPQARLAPDNGMERYRLQQWLNFIATELHKATYIPLLDRHSPDGAKAFARQKLALRFDYLSQQLAEHEYLQGYFTLADAYLITVLNWSPYAGIDLAAWPRLQSWVRAVKQRPAVARALAEEMAAYNAEMSANQATSP